MAISGDAVATGLVASMSKPGGNITGSTFFSLEIAAKRLELLKEIVPQIANLAVITNPDNTLDTLSLVSLERSARSLKLAIRSIPVRRSDDFEGAFREMRVARIDGVILLDDGVIAANGTALGKLSIRERLPSMGGVREFLLAGGLTYYSASQLELWRRAGMFIDKILKGVQPRDIPIEQSTRFEFGINLKTAKSLNIRVPHSVLVRADEVIE